MVAGLDGDHVIGVHVVTDPLTAANTATFIPGMADGLDDSDPVDRLIRQRMDEFTNDGSGYLAIQNTRPQTIGYGLVDSPVLQLAWIAEKVAGVDGPARRSRSAADDRQPVLVHRVGGQRGAHHLRPVPRQRLGRPERRCRRALRCSGPTRPCGGSFPSPRVPTGPSSTRGLHFPAMEAPDDLVGDLRAFFGPLA